MGSKGRPVEVHPDIQTWDAITRTLKFIEALPRLSDEQRFDIFMSALDTSEVSINIALVQDPPSRAAR